MSVIVVLVTATDDDAERLIQNPDQFQAFMMGGELVFENQEEKANYFRNRILPKSLQGAVRPEMADMDKAWAGIDHILRKIDSTSLGFITEGGREIREIPKKKRKKQPGWLLARAFSTNDVIALNDALANIDNEQFVAQYDADELQRNEVYPFEFAEPDLDYLVHWFGVMKQFVHKRASNKEAMLVTEG